MEATVVQADRETPSQSSAGSSTTPTSHIELSQKIAALAGQTAQQLRAEWRRLYRSHPPRLSRDLLVRTLAYRMQELAYGGLSKATQRKLTTLTKGLVENGSIVSDPNPRIRPGVRLVRDTLAINAVKIRLQGIDAPETDQICLDAKGERWTCGIDARDQLISHVANQQIICILNGADVYRRMLGTCRLNGEDLNAWMVQEGWALAYVKYSTTYVRVEEGARSHLRGIWRGAFIAPWDWRHRNNKTTILGAFSIPINAQSLLLPPSGIEGAPSAECAIKGNVNRDGERIYHMPNQQFYPKIKMDAGVGRRWFCTPEEAEAAGWRRALR